ncbi:MAG: oxidoreductase [Bacteroidales bacterium]|nr:oxidoreductase [Bacteroidales bacterium]
MKQNFSILIFTCLFLFSACSGDNKKSSKMKDKDNKMVVNDEVKILMLDPGHFHAALVQKSMYPNISPLVYVYAPEGPDVNGYLKMISGFNSREESPASWEEKVYTGDDYLEKMLADKAGNLVVLSGNNAKKTEYIKSSVDAGLYVLADKPMVITPEEFPLLEEAFKNAQNNGVLLYDIMTERHEITTILQKALSGMPEIFGELEKGSLENPGIAQESIHRFSKIVAGSPLIRPAWFFDVAQQGEGIVDITSHLVDLIQWEAFPGKIIKKEDIQVVKARHWTTDLTQEQFTKVTALDIFPEYLNKYVEDGLLKVYSNGEINYTINGVSAKVSVIWNFNTPKGDTHYSIMRGSLCNLIIRQEEEQQFKPVLYIEPAPGNDMLSFEKKLNNAIDKDLAVNYPGIKLIELDDNKWSLDIPQKYKIGHEAHFRQVTEKFLQYIKEGKLPEWEVPNMITKYYITTKALELARSQQ